MNEPGTQCIPYCVGTESEGYHVRGYQVCIESVYHVCKVYVQRVYRVCTNSL